MGETWTSILATIYINNIDSRMIIITQEMHAQEINLQQLNSLNSAIRFTIEMLSELSFLDSTVALNRKIRNFSTVGSKEN